VKHYDFQFGSENEGGLDMADAGEVAGESIGTAWWWLTPVLGFVWMVCADGRS